jgi:hypothetical protein
LKDYQVLAFLADVNIRGASRHAVIWQNLFLHGQSFPPQTSQVIHGGLDGYTDRQVATIQTIISHSHLAVFVEQFCKNDTNPVVSTLDFGRRSAGYRASDILKFSVQRIRILRFTL